MLDTARFLIRPFEPSDFTRECPVTVEAWRGIFDGFHAQIGDELFEYFYDGWEERKFAEFSASMNRNQPEGRSFTIVDRTDGSVAAMGSWTPSGNFGVICSNAARADLRGCGLGSAMHRTLLDSMRRKGMRYAKVGTGLDDAHAPARRSYGAAGLAFPVPSVTYFRSNETSPHEPALPEGVVIDAPRADEAEAVAAMAVECWQPIWRESRRMLGDELFAARGDVQAAKYQDALRAARSPHALVLRDRGSLAGFAFWSSSDVGGRPFAQVGLNGVADAFKGHGYGYLLQQAATAQMLAAGIPYAKVITGLDAGHAPARHTYEKAGFAACFPTVELHCVL